MIHLAPIFRLRVCVFFSVILCSSWVCAESRQPDFETEIAPILIKRCVECHRGDRSEGPAGDLDLTSQPGFASNEVIDPGSPLESPLLQRVVDGEMPPPQKGMSQKLDETEIKLLEDWVAAGAQWPIDRTLHLFEKTNEVRAGLDWWSLQPIKKTSIPEPLHDKNPIDFFVERKLAAAGFEPAPPADKRTLIRRLYYDLIGLPPSVDQIQSFVDDDSRDAWQKQVNLLLDSPHYGERWARYWLDLVRYADTSGYERDQEKKYAWRYRDWVIEAFNSDMPYNDFVTQQLAGDEIDGRSSESLIATGFLRLGTWNDEPNEPKDYVYDRLEDLVHTTSAAFLGLTIKCARCHTHKFDPIEQDDYYRFASAFWPGPIRPGNKDFVGGPDPIKLGHDSVLGWTDIDTSPDPLFVLKNGEREQPLHEIVPASISTIPGLVREFDPPAEGALTTRRRLQLAQWITDSKNPLTARVIVNRIWLHHFGSAIVRSPNNFGFLADPPTHPELLDWLAANFQERGGSIKAIHRLILNSKTWKQSAEHPKFAEYSQVDSTNRLWWHAQRRRLDAESIRDSILDSTGELDRRFGGECFKATVHPEALEGLSRLTDDWQASPESMQNRRSIYMFMKRILLPPMMTTFDLCDATQSCGKRNSTMAPTQALTLLNNQFMHTRAEHLAQQVLRSEFTPKRRIIKVWNKILRRNPSESELKLAAEHLKDQEDRIANPANPDDDGSEAVKIQESINRALCFHIRANQSKLADDGKHVIGVEDLSGNKRHAYQFDAASQPTLRPDGFGGQDVIQFDGSGQFMHIRGQLLTDQSFTVFIVASDEKESGQREILSNWKKDENTTTSFFMGLTGDQSVRLSDAFSFVGEIKNPTDPFLLSAFNSPAQVAVYQNGQLISSIGTSLQPRTYGTPWVIGNQGDHPDEFWKGGIAEIRVYNRNLLLQERRLVEEELAERYDLPLAPAPIIESNQPNPEMLALASLCLVLMNSNEFIYVD